MKNTLRVSSTVFPKVCSAIPAQVVRESQYISIFCASRSTKIFLVVRVPEKFGNHCSSRQRQVFSLPVQKDCFKLPDSSGRGRKLQLRLGKQYGLPRFLTDRFSLTRKLKISMIFLSFVKHFLRHEKMEHFTIKLYIFKIISLSFIK